MKNAVLLLTVLGLSLTTSHAQSQEKVYALLIMNFAKNIQWPQHHEKSFTIGVFNYPPLVKEIENSAQNKLIAGKKIEVKEVFEPEEVKGCAIVFVPSFKSKKLPDMLKHVGNSSTLIITNQMEFQQGSNINLLMRDGKLIYEINNKSIEARGMKVPSSVKSMGIMVE